METRFMDEEVPGTRRWIPFAVRYRVSAWTLTQPPPLRDSPVCLCLRNRGNAPAMGKRS
ncbi:hypothetical protein NHX12_023437, partial [Muraenolepis orangiensis]